MTDPCTELRVRTHVVRIERLERLRWLVSVDGRRLFTFCSEARARDAGKLEARRLDFVASDALRRWHREPVGARQKEPALGPFPRTPLAHAPGRHAG